MEYDGIQWDYRSEIRKKISPGTLLLSEPFMSDTYFKRAVCLICSHTKEDGTMGFILNKSLHKRVHDVIEDFPEFEADLFYGGPVGNDTLHFLHDNSMNLEGAQEVINGIWWGGDFEVLKTQIDAGIVSPECIRFFIGYSGWDDGQLKKEIIENSWILSRTKKEYLFDVSSDSLWRNIMNNMGGVYKAMSVFPENPILN